MFEYYDLLLHDATTFVGTILSVIFLIMFYFALKSLK